MAWFNYGVYSSYGHIPNIARPAGGSSNSPALGKGRGRGPGNPGPGGPPVGATGSGGDAGPLPDQGQGLSGADSSLLKGTDSKTKAETSGTEGVLVKGTD